MRRCIMAAVDVHDRTLVVKGAVGRAKPEDLVFPNDVDGRERMTVEFRRRAERAGAARVVFAYEAPSQGFGLYDRLTDAGFECHVLAPSRIKRSQKQRRSKTDRRDAGLILDTIRAHVLAGNDLPADGTVSALGKRPTRSVVRPRRFCRVVLPALHRQRSNSRLGVIDRHRLLPFGTWP